MSERLRDPAKPSGEERRDHEKHHLPFRSWCSHCVRGKSKEAPHWRQQETPTRPELDVDFMFMGEEESVEKVAVWVVKERLSKMLAAIFVPRKPAGEYAAERVVAFIRETGCDRIRVGMKSGNDHRRPRGAGGDTGGEMRAAHGGGKQPGGIERQ